MPHNKGGWFKDPAGHAQAARLGWRRRGHALVTRGPAIGQVVKTKRRFSGTGFVEVVGPRGAITRKKVSGKELTAARRSLAKKYGAKRYGDIRIGVPVTARRRRPKASASAPKTRRTRAPKATKSVVVLGEPIVGVKSRRRRKSTVPAIVVSARPKSYTTRKLKRGRVTIPLDTTGRGHQAMTMVPTWSHSTSVPKDYYGSNYPPGWGKKK